MTCPQIETPGGAVRAAHWMRQVCIDGAAAWACTRCGEIKRDTVDLSWCSVRPAPDPGAPKGWTPGGPCDCVSCETYLWGRNA